MNMGKTTCSRCQTLIAVLCGPLCLGYWRWLPLRSKILQYELYQVTQDDAKLTICFMDLQNTCILVEMLDGKDFFSQSSGNFQPFKFTPVIQRISARSTVLRNLEMMRWCVPLLLGRRQSERTPSTDARSSFGFLDSVLRESQNQEAESSRQRSDRPTATRDQRNKIKKFDAKRIVYLPA